MSDKHIEKPDSDASNDKTPPESSPFSPGSRKSTTDVNSGPKLTPLDKELASFQLSNNNHYSTLVQSLDVNKQDSTAKLSPTKPIDSIPLILSTENRSVFRVVSFNPFSVTNYFHHWLQAHVSVSMLQVNLKVLRERVICLYRQSLVLRQLNFRVVLKVSYFGLYFKLIFRQKHRKTASISIM